MIYGIVFRSFENVYTNMFVSREDMKGICINNETRNNDTQATLEEHG